VKVQLSLF